MKRFTLFLLVLLFVSCTTLGTKTIYRTEAQPIVQKIGYCTLSNIDSLSLIYPETALLFDSTINKFISIYSLDIPLKINSIENGLINKDIISEICKQNDLEALLITDLHFKHITYTFLFIPIVSNYDTYVEMQLYDKYGELLCATKHDTQKGNSYMKAPTPEKTLHDGVKGTFARIAKEMDWKTQTK